MKLAQLMRLKSNAAEVKKMKSHSVMLIIFLFAVITCAAATTLWMLFEEHAMVSWLRSQWRSSTALFSAADDHVDEGPVASITAAVPAATVTILDGSDDGRSLGWFRVSFWGRGAAQEPAQVPT